MVCVSLITFSSHLRRCLGDLSTGPGQYLSALPCCASSSILTHSSVACDAIFILGCEYNNSRRLRRVITVVSTANQPRTTTL
jgi:hypothetical protein